MIYLMLGLVIIAIIILVIGVIEIKRAGRCCGDCKYFSKCWGSYNCIMADNPACKDFKENKHES